MYIQVKALSYSIEHQKRGMPHIHMLITLDKEAAEKLCTPEGVDNLICAEIPREPPACDKNTPAGLQEAELREDDRQAGMTALRTA